MLSYVLLYRINSIYGVLPEISMSSRVPAFAVPWCGLQNRMVFHSFSHPIFHQHSMSDCAGKALTAGLLKGRVANIRCHIKM